MADYVRIFPADDKTQAIHLICPGMDYTICGHDISDDTMVHRKPPVRLEGSHRITCKHCLHIIVAVKQHLNL